MIQPLRRVHRWSAAGLGVVLPAVFLSGLAVRAPFPQENDSLSGSDWSDSQLSKQSEPLQRLLMPDLLVYWSPIQPAGEALPQQARLLGSLHGADIRSRSFPTDGYLILYSLGHQRVVTAMPANQKEKQQ